MPYLFLCFEFETCGAHCSLHWVKNQIKRTLDVEAPSSRRISSQCANVDNCPHTDIIREVSTTAGRRVGGAGCYK